MFILVLLIDCINKQTHYIQELILNIIGNE